MTRVCKSHNIERALALMNGKLPAAGTLVRNLLDRTIDAMSADDMHANMGRLASTLSDLVSMMISQQSTMPSGYGRGGRFDTWNDNAGRYSAAWVDDLEDALVNVLVSMAIQGFKTMYRLCLMEHF